MNTSIALTDASARQGRDAVSGWNADEAVEELYAAHWTSLVRLAALLLHDTGRAEEVVQDAFVAMHGRWHRLREPDKALAYIRQSVVNKSRSALRHRGVAQRHLAAEAPRTPTVVPGPDADAISRRDAVLDALATLPGRQREVLVLRHYLDLSEAEIARTLDISAGAVKSHASRGSATLRAALAAHAPNHRENSDD